MKVDMSPAAITSRLETLGELWKLGIELMKANPKNPKHAGITKMSQTVEATIECDGRIILHEQVALGESRRALVTILDEGPKLEVSESVLLSEKSLAESWNTPEEDRAWQHLAELPSC